MFDKTYQSRNMTSEILIWSICASISEKSLATSEAPNDPRCFLPFFIPGGPPSRPDICRYNPTRGIIFPSARGLLVTHFGCLLISGRCDALITADNDRRCNVRRARFCVLPDNYYKRWCLLRATIFALICLFYTLSYVILFNRNDNFMSCKRNA